MHCLPKVNGRVHAWLLRSCSLLQRVFFMVEILRSHIRALAQTADNPKRYAIDGLFMTYQVVVVVSSASEAQQRVRVPHC